MKRFSVIVSIIILLCCCTRQSAQLPSNKATISDEKMDMMTYNKMCIEAEMAEIGAYLDSSSVEFIKSDAGYWYKVVNSNKEAKVNDIVTISGTVQVLGGTPCKELDSLTLRLGKRDHTKVLDLALANAHVGDEIWIISPSSLAYGIKGISNCITSRTPVLYKIKVLKTNE
jgi:hypothetical protein